MAPRLTGDVDSRLHAATGSKCWLVIAVTLAVSLPAAAGQVAAGQRSKGQTPAAPQAGQPEAAPQVPATHTSRNFVLHTDLPATSARELLERLETMLKIISRYWGRANQQVIECYVVRDLARWPQGSMDPEVLSSLRGGGGLTKGRVARRGNRLLSKAIVYAVADRGTPQHEAVHAYCIQAFGRTGPLWYAEGMAEMGQYWVEGDSAVHCPQVVVDYLRNAKLKSLNAIVNSRETTGDSWQNYAWRWALCHLLANNANYAPRFRPLGLALLNKRDVSFETVYGSMAPEIAFEYRFFLKHLDRGYRVDLCSWDWKAKYRRPRGQSRVVSRIHADRGWQPSRLLVRQGERYAFTAEGTWSLTADGQPLSAAGGKSDQGRLVGAVFDDYALTEAFPLGASGQFTAARDGKLVLRCQDRWHDLADNKGTLTVRISVLP
jgi:hypothetical protein